jgi:hypothetical protein
MGVDETNDISTKRTKSAMSLVNLAMASEGEILVKVINYTYNEH